MWHSRPVSTPPPFMANAILNFHFDFLHTSLSDVLPAPCRRYIKVPLPVTANTLGEIWPTAGCWFHIWRLSKYNCTFLQCSTQDRLMSSQYSSCWLSVIRWVLCNYLLLTEQTHKRPHRINEAFVNIISQLISQQNPSQSLHLDCKNKEKRKIWPETLQSRNR